MLETLQYSTDLVTALGRSRVSNGKTLAETLTIDRISLWDAFAVELARIYVPAALSADDNAGSAQYQLIKPYLVRFRQMLRSCMLNRRKRTCLPWPTGKTVLCLDFSEHMSREVVQPIAKRLVEHGRINVVQLKDTRRKQTTTDSQHDIFLQTVSDHFDERLNQRVVMLRAALRKVEGELYENDDLLDLINNKNPTLWKQLAKVFRRLFIYDFYFFLQFAAVAQHLLEEHRPVLVISPDVADPRTRIYTQLCRQMGIPSLDVQFGLVAEEGIEWRFFQADRLSVWGPTSKELMLKHGVPDSSIMVTGSPRHDLLVTLADNDKQKMRQTLGIPEERTIILLASAYQLKAYNDYSDPEILKSMKRAVFEAADKVDGIALIVKPHPSEDLKETRSLAGAKKNIFFVSQTMDIRILTQLCDAFISFGSTATVDALILGKLVICPVFPGWIWSDIYKQSAATLVPTSNVEVQEIFNMLANGKGEKLQASVQFAQKTFSNNWVYRTDGKATDRIVELALKMVG